MKVSDESADLLRHLNRFYATRHDLKHLPDVYRFLMEAVTIFRHDHGVNARLLECSDSVRDAIYRVLVTSIEKIKRTGSKQPDSLASKFCHFLLPDTFAIFDDQAAASIEMWRYFAFNCEVEPNSPGWNQFRRARLHAINPAWATAASSISTASCGRIRRMSCARRLARVLLSSRPAFSSCSTEAGQVHGAGFS